MLSPCGKHLIRPDRRIEHGFGMNRVHAYAIRSPLQRGDACKLRERRLGGRVGCGAGPRRPSPTPPRRRIGDAFPLSSAWPDRGPSTRHRNSLLRQRPVAAQRGGTQDDVDGVGIKDMHDLRVLRQEIPITRSCPASTLSSAQAAMYRTPSLPPTSRPDRTGDRGSSIARGKVRH